MSHNTVWKFPLNNVPGRNVLDVPRGFIPIAAAYQPRGLMLWGICLIPDEDDIDDEDKEKKIPEPRTEELKVNVIGTGGILTDDEEWNWVATVFQSGFVHHVFTDQG